MGYCTYQTQALNRNSTRSSSVHINFSILSIKFIVKLQMKDCLRDIRMFNTTERPTTHDEAADVEAKAGELATMAKSTSHKPSRLANAADSLSLQVNHLALRILFCAINAKRSAFTFARPSDQRLVAEPAPAC